MQHAYGGPAGSGPAPAWSGGWRQADDSASSDGKGPRESSFAAKHLSFSLHQLRHAACGMQEEQVVSSRPRRPRRGRVMGMALTCAAGNHS